MPMFNRILNFFTNSWSVQNLLQNFFDDYSCLPVGKQNFIIYLIYRPLQPQLQHPLILNLPLIIRRLKIIMTFNDCHITVLLCLDMAISCFVNRALLRFCVDTRLSLIQCGGDLDQLYMTS